MQDLTAPLWQRIDPAAEWLETDGLGGFASGTAAGVRTRRYHALLLAATTPPSGRFLLVNGLETWVETEGHLFPLTSQIYAPNVRHPDGASRIVSFTNAPWPRWELRLPDGSVIEHELVVPHGLPAVLLFWRLTSGEARLTLRARPLMSGRDPHALHRENGAFRFEPRPELGGLVWRPYDGVPGVLALGGEYEHRPDWYRNFAYAQERARGLDFIEDLASPGIFTWTLSLGEEASLLLVADGPELRDLIDTAHQAPSALALRATEMTRRERVASRLDRAADAYIVKRSTGKTIIAGYPWFGDWGRDTFIALRGLCLATGRLEEAGRILTQWSGAVSQGMVPNRFPDRGDLPEYNSVDASLWYVIVAYEYFDALRRTKGAGRMLAPNDERAIREAIESILDGYARGTRYGIRADDDGLLSAGEPGVPLTWMDAKVGGRAVTPRIGKPVEVQALWLNALKAAAVVSARWKEPFERGHAAFLERFWNEARGFLYDVVDVDHVRGANDARLRPNQLFAVGGLPWNVLDGARARRVVEIAEEKLWTPMGPRSLAPGEPGYARRYEGGVAERDSSYHQGTVWPWLAGAFVQAWVNVHGGTEKARHDARAKFLAPLMTHLDTAGLGHICEIADAEPPHTPRGCPFQAWSVAEVLRLDRVVLAES